ncbi:Wax ester synthase-like Acyl-CoA acyltransferase domain-containing protein [Nannocystis exedens]|uniref:Wax ester synthase-like Acyl-CoA acyltransferase domain-containing protein n=1 Tax=Nannocystis exedens TaxID=54 RepID=A0A1I2FGT8_9BACT|nr:wax ester/triacylglycerol synthase domain-containing protein [Nannocystis exedens]PCC70445.1 Wax ester synthase-like Acyl-CoA acyltransferase domain protein [Nannocystis exedens]SFF04203.1 Wax ester synthase-like Acyl-CoA acyltransferase domain-containing protein [Nannocystis exedens]
MEITVAEGLQGGRIALVCKVHHAGIDGAAMATVLKRVMSSADDAHDVARRLGVQLANRTLGVLGNVLGLLVRALFVVFVMFYLFRDARMVRPALASAIPLHDRKTREILIGLVDNFLRPRLVGKRASCTNSSSSSRCSAACKSSGSSAWCSGRWCWRSPSRSSKRFATPEMPRRGQARMARLTPGPEALSATGTGRRTS